MAKQRGLDAIDEQNQRQIIRDTRTYGEKISDFLKNPQYLGLILGFFVIINMIFSVLDDIMFLISLGFFAYAALQKTRLPFRLPQRSGLKDYNDLKPGGDKPNKARGIYFFGNDRKTNDELWFSDGDMRTHVLIFGSTGSGKTEALVSIAYNALLQSSGFIYVDGKGDNGLYAKIFSMVRSMGRADDMLLINFMTGARDVVGPQTQRLSNTMNPFASGSSSMLAQLVVSLMDGSGSGSDGDMWKGRAIGFVEALMKVLVAMRDGGHLLLDANTIRNYFHLERLETMVIDKLFPRDGQESVKLDNLPKSILEPIYNYLLTLPGYNKEKKGRQVSQVLEQHGFITMQLTRVFTSLADTYGHIMRTNLAEVDVKDVVLNRRILLVLLPALEKSPDELANLGKVVIASMKAMMAAGLGDSVEGSFADLVERKPTNAKTPYLCILDEYGYYAVEGFAVVPAQARSLGFSVIFAGQDLPAFQKASKEEAASIGANTNIKICMKLEDPVETWDFFMKTAGESYVAHVESFQSKADSPFMNYRDNAGARLEKRARIDLLDLKEQREGEAHLFFQSKIVRMKFFFANPKPANYLRLNHFLKVETPYDSDVVKLQKSFDYFESIQSKPIQITSDLPESELQDFIDIHQSCPEKTPFAKAISSLMYFGRDNNEDDFIPEMALFDDIEFSSNNKLNAFLPLNVNDYLKTVVVESSLTDTFQMPLLNRSDTRDGIEYLERLLGNSSQHSVNVAMEVMGDIYKGTDYPPAMPNVPDGETYKHKVGALISAIKNETENSEK